MRDSKLKLALREAEASVTLHSCGLVTPRQSLGLSVLSLWVKIALVEIIALFAVIGLLIKYGS